MNIHINEDQYNELKKGTILSIKMGSSMYGCEISSSDTDYLHIFAHNEHWENSFIWTHHNFQYKSENTDHVFVSLKNFVRNLIKGDSTINYECLFSKEMETSKELSFLFDLRKKFNNYSVIRAYLGLVKRDLKIFGQSYENKKLFHAVRGLYSAKLIIQNNYSNNLRTDSVMFNLLMDIRNNKLSRIEMIDLMRKTSDECLALRSKISQDLQNKQINRLMNISDMKALDSKVITVCSSSWYKDKMNHDFLADEVYGILENDIEYE